jgi:hypothetical protein
MESFGISFDIICNIDILCIHRLFLHICGRMVHTAPLLDLLLFVECVH